MKAECHNYPEQGTKMQSKKRRMASPQKVARRLPVEILAQLGLEKSPLP